VWRWYVVRKVDGVTGDAVGAVNEMNESLTLLLFVFLLSER
jgi:cobalamin synthase